MREKPPVTTKNQAGPGEPSSITAGANQDPLELFERVRAGLRQAGQEPVAFDDPLYRARIRALFGEKLAYGEMRFRRSWLLSLSATALCLLAILLLPLVAPYGNSPSPSKTSSELVTFSAPQLEGVGPPQAPAPIDLPPPKTASSSDFVAQGEPSPPVAQVPSDMAGRIYRDVAYLQVTGEELQRLEVSTPSSMMLSDGSLLLTTGDSGASIRTVTLGPILARQMVLLPFSVQGPDELPVGDQLLILNTAQKATYWFSPGWLAWNAFLNQVWPWPLMMLCSALITLALLWVFRKQAIGVVFLLLLLLSIAWPGIASREESAELVRGDAAGPQSLGVPLPVILEEGGQVISYASIERNSQSAASPFRIQAGTAVPPVDTILEDFGLVRISNHEQIAAWIWLPPGQMQLVNGLLIGSKILLILVPLLLYIWLLSRVFIPERHKLRPQ